MNAGPALLSLIALPFLPDSPRYLLLVRNRRLEAERGRRHFSLNAALPNAVLVASSHILQNVQESKYTPELH